MNVLVVGGAGYIGSHMVNLLGANGICVTTLDDLSSGRREAVTYGELVVGNLGDRQLLDKLLSGTTFDAVMHFAAYIDVGESVADPAKYYQNNVVNTKVLLDAMRTYAVRNFIFSSTAAIFGEPEQQQIDESHPQNPINPYGRSKFMVEQILGDYDAAYGLKSVCLRYFNAAGADPHGEIGECHDPESHLVPLVLQAASGRRKNITIFGSDYGTPDGTCVRDYIHVVDLCDAHLLALRALAGRSESRVYNLGNGNGFSVREVIDTACAVAGREIPVVHGDRRAGDPARLVADASRAKKELGWSPKFADLDAIVTHAWHWEQHRCKELGKGDV